MTYREALDYAKNVLTKKNFAKSDSPKKVEVLDIGNTIASQKLQPGGYRLCPAFQTR
jgi:hypothetical protein